MRSHRELNNASVILKTIKDSYSLLDRTERKSSIKLFLLSAISEALQILSILSVMPLINLIIYEDTIHKSEALNSVWVYFGSPEHALLVTIFSIFTILLIILSYSFNYFVLVLCEKFTISSQQRLIKEIFPKILSAPHSWFVSQNVSKIVRLIYADIGVWARDVVRAVIRTAALIPIIISSVGVVLYTSPMASLLIIFIATMLLSILLKAIKPKQSVLAERKKVACDDVMATATDFIESSKEIKITGWIDKFSKTFEKQYFAMNESNSRLLILSNLPGIFLSSISQIFLVIIAIVLWNAGGSSQEIFNQLTVLLLIVSRTIPVLSNVSTNAVRISNVAPWVESLLKLYKKLNYFKDKASLGKNSDSRTLIKRIELKDLGFSYEHTQKILLQNINILMRQGSFYGITGESGSGKSTIIDLILGLQSINNGGQLLINGEEYKSIDNFSLYQAIGYVPQKPSFIDDSIKNNVIFGHDFDKELFDQCIDNTSLRSFIDELPDGIDTYLGDSSIRASGGQRQRIAIARALYKRPSLLILDEATSSLDIVTEEHIMRAINANKNL